MWEEGDLTKVVKTCDGKAEEWERKAEDRRMETLEKLN